MKYIGKTAVLVALIVLIILRICLNNVYAIPFIQYAGLGIVIFDFFGKLLRKNHSVSTILVVVLSILIFIVVAILGITHVIPWLGEAKALDVVTLLTLAISLPEELYLKLFIKESNYV